MYVTITVPRYYLCQILIPYPSHQFILYSSHQFILLSKKMHSISYHFCREAVAAEIVRIAKEDATTNFADFSQR